ncbi:phosphinothricin n-acetyltransferase [Kandleria vitulina DSM 20405]|uniref:Phosphinothricin n-acetyltransferase n=1 Tax=Kandleria vitulina DSM 20405 TaxID=1410657 RepID=A0A0R2HMH5_9FIRM|nr:GNAT family N-acetyltransferase [Kandleria vitulina]KRN50714.1 phosphinothricin n-acetyltransferase [Kandleria vitulina DSM 20405]
MHIRDAKIEDAKRLIEIYNYYIKNTAITFEYDEVSEDEFIDRMKEIMSFYPYLVIEDEGQVQGYAYAHAFYPRAAYSWSCELSIYLDHHAKGKGYGRKLYEEIEKALFKMGMTNLYACISVPEVEDETLTNNSAQFHAHLGFHKVGTFKNCGYKFDRWYHMIWMEKIINEHVIHPSIKAYKDI